MGPVPRADDSDLVTDLAVDDQLRAFVDEVRSSYAFGPPPETGARLATVLARGLAGEVASDQHPGAVPSPVEPRSRQPLADRVQDWRIRLGLGAAVAGLTFFGTGAAGALPGPVQSVFERTVEVVGIDLPEAARTPRPAPAPAPGGDAPTVSPSGRSEGERPSPSPAESPQQEGARRGGGGNSPFDTGTNPPPRADTPSQAGTPGQADSRRPGDARPNLPDGVPAPAAPGPAGRPGFGPPPGVADPDDGEDEERGRPGQPSGRLGATAPGPSAGQAPASGPAARSQR